MELKYGRVHRERKKMKRKYKRGVKRREDVNHLGGEFWDGWLEETDDLFHLLDDLLRSVATSCTTC